MAKITITNPQPFKGRPRHIHTADGHRHSTCRYCGSLVYGHNRRICFSCQAVGVRRDIVRQTNAEGKHHG